MEKYREIGRHNSKLLTISYILVQIMLNLLTFVLVGTVFVNKRKQKF